MRVLYPTLLGMMLLMTQCCVVLANGIPGTLSAQSANATVSTEKKSANHFVPNVYTLSIGAGWPINDQKNQTLSLEPDLESTYTGGSYHRVPVQGELFVGWQESLPLQLIGQIGLAVGASSNVSIIGSIWEDADPVFDNYTYGYLISHRQVMVEGVLLVPYWNKVTPYIKAGVGAGFNQAYGYTITPSIINAVAPPAFQSHLTSTFTYMVAAGLQKSISSNWQAGLGYAFSDWGKSQFNPATGETLNNAPSMSHYYVNSLVIQLSYLR
jgi:opacity protein-like surface antigen